MQNRRLDYQLLFFIITTAATSITSYWTSSAKESGTEQGKDLWQIFFSASCSLLAAIRGHKRRRIFFCWKIIWGISDIEIENGVITHESGKWNFRTIFLLCSIFALFSDI